MDRILKARESNPLYEENLIEAYKDYHRLIFEETENFNPAPKWARGKKVLPVRDSKSNPKTGRNDTCPKCDSGKKYKRCCMKKESISG
jgi:uncharacterized protein YecA (UPF0149 family)